MGRGTAVATALLSTAVAAAAAASPVSADDEFDATSRADRAVIGSHLDRTAKRLTSGTAYPLIEDDSRRWRTGAASDWRSGFWPASMWTQYAASLEKGWKTNAERFMPGLVGQASRTDTHDVGFNVFLPFREQYRLVGDGKAKDTILKAATSLASRYSATVGATRSWNTTNGRFRVIVDNLMNLELLFWAARNGGNPEWAEMAHQHALTSLREHVRADGSTHHVVDFDPSTGATIARWTHEPTNTTTTWSRGQAWAVHGLTGAYRETGDARLLEGARRTGGWYLDHVPADGVPLFDFGAPAGDPPDSSASAIAAAGLMELARLDPDPAFAARWREGAERLVTQLSASPYLDRSGASEATLLRSTQSTSSGLTDRGLPYGEYYLAQALDRRRLLPSSEAVLPAVAVSTSGTPGAAVDGDPATAWRGAAGATIRLDMRAVGRVHALSLTLADGQIRTARFKVSVGTSVNSLPVVLSTASSGTTNGEETFDLPDADARYLRVTIVGSTDGAAVPIAEMRLR